MNHSNQKKSLHNFFLASGIAFICIAAGFIIMQTYYYSITNNPVSVNVSITDAGGSEDYEVEIEQTKRWTDRLLHRTTPFGAQYDGVIYNNEGHNLRDWSIKINYKAENVIMDSYWNGRYEMTDGDILIVSEDYNDEILTGDSTTFGFVMYYDSPIEFTDATLTGYKVVRYTSLPGFWFLLFAVVSWFAASVAAFFFVKRTQVLIERQKQDERIIVQSINTFAGMIDAKDSYTQGHSARVAYYSAEIAKRMGFAESEIKTLYYVALMHDCGKIGVPDAILTKPGSLSSDEMEMVQSHTIRGEDILKNFSAIPEILTGALYHHERYDGNGYPEGLAGEDIPLYARIICIADSYDAMSSRRCYRKPLSEETIISELYDNSGKQFDPHIVGYMIDMIKDGFVETVKAKNFADLSDNPFF